MASVLYGIANFFGEVLGLVGMLVFGFGVTWLLVNLLHQPDQPWQLQAVVAGMFFVLAVVVIWRAAPGDFGAFTLGAGGGFLYWGYLKTRKAEEPLPPAAAEEPKGE